NKITKEFIMQVFKWVLLILGLMISSKAFAQERDVLKLQYTIDSLESRMRELETRQSDHFSIMSKSLEMGKGFFFTGKSGSDYIFTLETGYFWSGNDDDLKENEMYLGRRSDFRYGLSAGVQYFQDIPVNKNDHIFYQSTGYGVFGKINLGTPVMMNFVSLSFHLKPMYLIPAKNNDHGITKNRMALGYGYDLEFWLTQNKCATIGFTDETDDLSWDKRDDSIYPSKIRLMFGFKTFF
ncbi:MAG: hypothetical protein D6707_10380, partial [Bacteroidetes bacterium]